MDKTNRGARKSTPSAEQIAYASALAGFRVIDEAFKATAFLCPDGATEEEIEAFDDAREEVRETSGWYVAKAALVAAEETMVKWCLARAACYAARNATPAQAADVAALYDRARRSADGWTRLVDLAWRLAA